MPDEIGELKEHAEEGAHEPSLVPVTLTMAILAVVIATVTLLGHRAHTEEVLLQSRAADQWAYFQAKEIRRRSYELFLDELSIFSLQDAKQVDAVREKYKKQVDRYSDELKEIETEGRQKEAEVKVEEARADRYDLSEVLLEAALVISSITLLTRKKIFWLFGIILRTGGAGSKGCAPACDSASLEPRGTPLLSLPRSGRPRLQVLPHILRKRLLQFQSNRPRRRRNLPPVHLAHSQQITIRRGNKNLIRRVQILLPQYALFHRSPRASPNLQQHTPRNPLQTSRRHRRSRHPTMLHAKNIRRRAFRYFAPLVQQHHLIKTRLLRLVIIPNIIQPRNHFHSSQWRRRMPPVLAQSQPRRLAISRQIRGTQQQIHARKILIAAPESHLVVNHIHPRRALPHLIRAQHLRQFPPHHIFLKWKRAMRPLRIALQSFPMPLERKRNPFVNPHRREQTPAIQQPGLPRRQPHLRHRQQAVIVKYKTVNHPASNVLLILAQNPRPAPSFGKYQAKPASLAPASRYIDSSSFVSAR